MCGPRSGTSTLPGGGGVRRVETFVEIVCSLFTYVRERNLHSSNVDPIVEESGGGADQSEREGVSPLGTIFKSRIVFLCV